MSDEMSEGRSGEKGVRVEVRPLTDAVPDDQNANDHTQRGQAAVQNSIAKNGFFRPIAAAGKGTKRPVVKAGNLTQEVALDLGLEEAVFVYTDGRRPIVHVRTDLDPDSPEAAALALADNRAAEVSLSWNPAVLLSLTTKHPDAAEGLFTKEELGDILSGLKKAEESDQGEPGTSAPAEKLRDKYGVAPGQLWILGNHALACGDCRDEALVGRLFDRVPAYGLYDPPYGIDVVKGGSVGGDKAFGSVGGDGVVQANEYPPIFGDDEPFDPTYALTLTPTAIFWGANYYAGLLPNSRGWFAWDKKGQEWNDNFSDCEFAWTSFDRPAKIYRHVWMGMVQEGEREKRVHPTQKPVALYVKLIEEYFDDPEGIVADLYAGSGTTLLACERLGRASRCMEYSPDYTAIILDRWSTMTGLKPVRVAG